MAFLILCLPRSRSAWLASYLNYPLARPPQPIGHEVLTECRSWDEFVNNYKRGMWGTVETAGAMLWQNVRKEMPECKIVLVRRPLIEVYRSLAAKGIVADLHVLAEMNAILDWAQNDPAIASVPFEFLSEPLVGKWLFEYLLEIEWDEEWWMRLVATNIQVDIPGWQKKANGKKDVYRELINDICRRSLQPPGPLN